MARFHSPSAKKQVTPHTKKAYSLLDNTIYTFREIWNTKKTIAIASIMLIFLSPVLSIKQ